MIDFNFEDMEVPDFDSELFALWLARVVKDEGKLVGEIDVVFCSDDYLLEINRKYLDHDYYTDIITFDYSEGDYVAGDLFISVDRVIENANDLKVLFTQELKRVIVHGVLHLLGYKDKSEQEVELMRLKEDEALANFVSRET